MGPNALFEVKRLILPRTAPSGQFLRRLLEADPTVDHTSDGLAARQARVRASATKLRTPSYTLKEFHDDMVYGFPELRLYLGPAGTGAAWPGP